MKRNETYSQVNRYRVTHLTEFMQKLIPHCHLCFEMIPLVADLTRNCEALQPVWDLLVVICVWMQPSTCLLKYSAFLSGISALESRCMVKSAGMTEEALTLCVVVDCDTLVKDLAV